MLLNDRIPEFAGVDISGETNPANTRVYFPEPPHRPTLWKFIKIKGSDDLLYLLPIPSVSSASLVSHNRQIKTECLNHSERREMN